MRMVISLQQVTNYLRHTKKGLSCKEVEFLEKQLDNIGAGKSSKLAYSRSLSDKLSVPPTFSLLQNDFVDFISTRDRFSLSLTVCESKLYILQYDYYGAANSILNISIEDIFTKNLMGKISEVELHANLPILDGSVALDASLNLILVDAMGNTVIKFNSKGKELTRKTLSSPMGVAIDLQGKIFACDHSNHRIQILSSDLQLLGEFGSEEDFSNMFQFPSDVACDRQGNIYIADSGNSCVKVFTSGLEPLPVIGQTGELCKPVCLCIDGDDFLYVVDSSLKMVFVYDCEGNFQCTFGQFVQPQSIAVDDKGHVYIIDTNSDNNEQKDCLQIYSRTL